MSYTPEFSQLLPTSVQNLVRYVATAASPKKIILFGSRARGTHRENSDFDIAIVQKNCSEEDWTKILVYLSTETLTLHKVDLAEYELLAQDYRNNIQKEGKTLYESIG